MLRRLEYLVALARERHFGRAAALCDVSQPSLSAGIRRLERDLGVSIVRRGQRFDGFTPEGERVVGWARRIMADCDALREDLASMGTDLTGTLRVGAIPTALGSVSLLTGPFCAAHPRVRVSVESLSSRDIVTRLGEFDLDVGLTYLSGDLTGLRSVPLYRERYLLLTPSDSVPTQGPVSWVQVAQRQLCLLSPVMHNRQILDRAFADAGAVVTPSVEADTVSVLYAHVATGHWSTVIAHAWLDLFGVPEGCQVVPIEEPRQRLPQIGLLSAGVDPEPILARALLDTALGIDVRGVLDQAAAPLVSVPRCYRPSEHSQAAQPPS